MSTILKALRRLEQEKAASTDGRPLREEIAGALPAAEPRPSRRWGLAALSLVLGLAAGGSAILWMNRDGGDEMPTVAAAPSSGTRAAVRAEALPPAAARRAERPPGDVPPRAEAAAPAGGALPTDAFASPVEVVERPAALPRLSDPSPVEPARAPKPGQRRPVEDSSAAARARRALADAAAAGVIDPNERRPTAEGVLDTIERPPTAEAALAAGPQRAEPAEPPPLPRREAPSPRPAPEVAPAPAPSPRAAPAPAPAPAPKATPAPKPAPSQVAAAEPAPKPEPRPAAKPKPPAPAPEVAPLPGLLVEKTLWHPRPERRSAWLRLEGEDASRRVVEGDVVSGLLVAEIEPSGIVLERDGKRFVRGLGSSGQR